MRRYLRWAAMLAAVFIATGGLWLSKRLAVARTTNAAPSSAPAAEQTGSRSVEVVKPQRTTMSRVLDVPATIEAYEQADLYAKASGYVAQVRVDIGDRVKAGDVLAVIDVPEMAEELAEAEAQRSARRAGLTAAESHVIQAERMLDMARSQLRRYQADLTLKDTTARRREELFAGNAITQEQLDEARSELEIARADFGIAEAKIAAAQADVDSAEAGGAVAAAEVEVAAARIGKIKTLMEYARIVAPFDGVVTARMVDRGALVQAATTSRTMPLFTVQRIDRLRVFVDVPESDVAHVQPGTAARIKPYGLTETLEGKITRTSSSLKPDTRTMRTEIDLENADGRLLHGMYAQVVIALDERAAALTVPAATLLTEGKETFVYTVRDGQAARTAVTIGLDDGIRVEITSGLDDDALVVLTGKGLITSGARVRPVLKNNAS